VALLNQKGSAGAGQLSDADAQALSKLKALLAQGGGSGEMQQPLSGQNGETLEALLASLSSGNAQAGATAGVPQTGTQALDEIRRLFAELVASEQTAEGAQGAAAQSASTPSLLKDALPAQQSPQDAAAPKQATQGALFQAIAPGQRGDGKAATGGGAGLLSGKAEDKTASAAKHAGADEKTGVSGFDATLKAVRTQPETLAAQDSKKSGETAAARQAFDSIVDRITSMTNSSQKEMEISLKPDFLGKVVIKLSMDGGGSLIAKISASNPKVQDAMMNQAGALQSSLEAQGLKDVRIVVTSSAVADASLQQQADRRGQGDDSRNRRNAVVVDAADAADPSSPLSAYEQAYRTGSINYLA
jgi:flagellar hook-length control protein FliK